MARDGFAKIAKSRKPQMIADWVLLPYSTA
jgi:hypothetical protein